MSSKPSPWPPTHRSAGEPYEPDWDAIKQHLDLIVKPLLDAGWTITEIAQAKRTRPANLVATINESQT
jgi:hypothetical protein